MDVSRFNILGEEVNIKDKFLRDKITGIELTSLAVIGDSNAEGYGWWKGDRSKKTNQNDGYCAVLRELYPNAVIDNYSVSGATLSNANNDNNLKTQLDRLLNTNINYQHIIIQAGFNDISIKVSSNDNFIGIPRDGRNEMLNITDNTTCVNALCSYISSIKAKLPETKIHFLMRESQYNDNTIHQFAYLSMLRELSKVCQIIGIDFWNLANDGITSNINSQSSVYYYDSIHWNEKAFRDIVTPFIISGLLEYPKNSFSSVNNYMYINSFDFTDIFNNDVTTNNNINAFLSMLPDNYCFDGILLFKNKTNCHASIVKKTYLHIDFTRNNGFEKQTVEGTGIPYKKIKNRLSTGHQENILSDIENGFWYNEVNKIFTNGEYGSCITNLTANNRYLKTLFGISGSVVNTVINPTNNEVIEEFYNGGVLNFNIGLIGNRKLQSGIYFVTSGDTAKILDGPPTNGVGYALIVAKNYSTTYGFLIAINRNGIWITEAPNNNWSKIL